jgi:hypothetical protein
MTEAHFDAKRAKLRERSVKSGPFKLLDHNDWFNSGLARAATAYRRCCHWDFAPGEARCLAVLPPDHRISNDGQSCPPTI